MGKPVIVEAVRTPIGKRNGWLSGLQGGRDAAPRAGRGASKRAGIEPGEVEQIIGGCVTQAGEQGSNVTRNAWLQHRASPYEVGVHDGRRQCGSAQQANHLVAGLIAAGAIDVGIACGVEAMSRVPLGANVFNGPGHYKTDDCPWDDPPNGQFGAAERIAENRGITRDDVDAFGLASQQKAARAWAEGRFEREIVPDRGAVTADESTMTVSTATRACATPRSRGWPSSSRCSTDGIHTAGNISQISDGAAAVLWMAEDRAKALGPASRGPASCTRSSSAPTPTTCSTARSTPRARCSEGGHDDGRHRPVRGQRGVRLGRAVVGAGAQARHGQGQRQRRRHRARPPGRAPPAAG